MVTLFYVDYDFIFICTSINLNNEILAYKKRKKADSDIKMFTAKYLVVCPKIKDEKKAIRY